jgi:hypothetical protein
MFTGRGASLNIVKKAPGSGLPAAKKISFSSLEIIQKDPINFCEQRGGSPLR